MKQTLLIMTLFLFFSSNTLGSNALEDRCIKEVARIKLFIRTINKKLWIHGLKRTSLDTFKHLNDLKKFYVLHDNRELEIRRISKKKACASLCAEKMKFWNNFRISLYEKYNVAFYMSHDTVKPVIKSGFKYYV